MDILQILLNGVVLGTLYACIAVGFSLVWGVLNVINMLHGSFIILGGYLTYFAWHQLGIHPMLALPVVAAAPVRARLRAAVRLDQQGRLGARADHADADVRARHDPLQRHDGVLHRDAAARHARLRSASTCSASPCPSTG